MSGDKVFSQCYHKKLAVICRYNKFITHFEEASENQCTMETSFVENIAKEDPGCSGQTKPAQNVPKI